MKQLSQKLKDGRMEVIEVPMPALSKGLLLVQNVYSVISAGTEGSTVRAARKSMIGKAKERPDQARQMMDLLKQAGPVQAYRTAMKKLDAYSPLGYSCAGVVIDVGERVSGFAVGDRVACGGVGANHSEVVAVPQNLCVRLRPDADLKKAAYNTLGAIALQGVRQADLRLGESCAVIGLGLLGQLTCLLLKAGGIKVIGIDINPDTVALAKEHACDWAAVRTEIGLPERVDELTNAIGVDAVIITAATNSTDPVNFAGRVAKRKGRVVIVGNVPTGFDREPHYYKKELDLRMSCSYGPGRYDPSYEDRGIDYPPAYVRWTERRNMDAFQELIYSRRIDLEYLTTHVFRLEEAPQAYELITDNSEPYIGLMIEYGDQSATKPRVVVREAKRPAKVDDVAIAFVGAGSYAMSHLLPNIPTGGWINRKGVMTSSGLSSRTVAERFGFEYCTSEERQIFENTDINTVFIATRHDTHARYVIRALENHQRVFVEKPLCISEAELQSITNVVSSHKASGSMLMVGFNRRFSPLVEYVRDKIGTGPMSMSYRINAGTLPPDSWVLDKETGGGRIVGEGCHFIDLLTFINGSMPTKVQAFAMSGSAGYPDTSTINIIFENGSIGTICYCTNGAKSLPKEYLEIHSGGVTAIIKDFREVEVHSGKTTSKKLMFQDKGQRAMVAEFLRAVRNGEESPISFEELSAVTRATFRAVDSAVSGVVLAV